MRMLETGIEKEDDRQVGGLAGSEPLLAEAEAGNLVEPASRHFGRHVVGGDGGGISPRAIVHAKEHRGGGSRAERDRRRFRLEGPIEVLRDIGVEANDEDRKSTRL